MILQFLAITKSVCSIKSMPLLKLFLKNNGDKNCGIINLIATLTLLFFLQMEFFFMLIFVLNFLSNNKQSYCCVCKTYQSIKFFKRVVLNISCTSTICKIVKLSHFKNLELFCCCYCIFSSSL